MRIRGESVRDLSGKVVELVGLGVLALGLLLTVLGLRAGEALGEARWIVVLTGAVMTASGAWLNKKGRQVAFEPGEEFLARYDGPIVTYLRSFGADRQADSSRGGRVKLLGALPESRLTEEEQIARAIGQRAPMVAIGRPGERLPQLGAYRVYTSDDEWQDKVYEMLDRSELVVMRAGETEGFWWEIENVFKLIPPERIVLLLPKKRAEFETFAERIAPYLPTPLPEYSPGGLRASFGGILWFDEEFTPSITPARYLWTAPFRHEVAVSLRLLLTEAGKDFTFATLVRASGKKRLLSALVDLVFYALAIAIGVAIDSALNADATYMFAGFFVAFLVFRAMEMSPVSASPGKRLVGLKLLDSTGLAPRTTALFARSLMRMLSFMMGWGALISAVLVFKSSPTLHDAIMGLDVFEDDSNDDPMTQI